MVINYALNLLLWNRYPSVAANKVMIEQMKNNIHVWLNIISKFLTMKMTIRLKRRRAVLITVPITLINRSPFKNLIIKFTLLNYNRFIGLILPNRKLLKLSMKQTLSLFFYLWINNTFLVVDEIINLKEIDFKIVDNTEKIYIS